MRFYNRQHRHYCGIDLHVKTMYICILDGTGPVLVHRNVRSTLEAFLETIAPYRDDLVVAAECMSTCNWLADVCATEGIAFVLGHALAMKALHGGKAKNDTLDSFRSRPWCTAVCCHRPTCMPRPCDQPEICYVDDSIWCGNGQRHPADETILDRLLSVLAGG